MLNCCIFSNVFIIFFAGVFFSSSTLTDARHNVNKKNIHRSFVLFSTIIWKNDLQHSLIHNFCVCALCVFAALCVEKVVRKLVVITPTPKRRERKSPRKKNHQFSLLCLN